MDGTVGAAATAAPGAGVPVVGAGVGAAIAVAGAGVGAEIPVKGVGVAEMGVIFCTVNGAISGAIGAVVRTGVGPTVDRVGLGTPAGVEDVAIVGGPVDKGLATGGAVVVPSGFACRGVATGGDVMVERGVPMGAACATAVIKGAVGKGVGTVDVRTGVATSATGVGRGAVETGTVVETPVEESLAVVLTASDVPITVSVTTATDLAADVARCSFTTVGVVTATATAGGGTTGSVTSGAGAPVLLDPFSFRPVSAVVMIGTSVTASMVVSAISTFIGTTTGEGSLVAAGGAAGINSGAGTVRFGESVIIGVGESVIFVAGVLIGGGGGNDSNFTLFGSGWPAGAVVSLFDNSMLMANGLLFYSTQTFRYYLEATASFLSRKWCPTNVV